MPDVRAVLKHAKVLAITSSFESFSLVAVEALSVGCPVVAFDCPYGPGEILQNNLYGTLVPPYDTKALASSLIAQIKKPSPDCEIAKGRSADFNAAKIFSSFERDLVLGLNN